MAITIISKDQSTRYKFTSADNKLIVLEGVTIQNTKASFVAIKSSGTNNKNEAHIFGDIIAGSGISLTGELYGRNGKNFVNIGDTGSILATSGIGVNLEGGFARLDNFGKIFGISGAVQVDSTQAIIKNNGQIDTPGDSAIKILNTGQRSGSDIENNGSINARYYGIEAVDAGIKVLNTGFIGTHTLFGIGIKGSETRETVVINYGTISGSDSISMGSYGDSVVNYGRLIGNVTFGDGDNYFRNEGEVRDGSVDFGDNDDIFNNSNGSVAYTINFRDGNNTFINIDGTVGSFVYFEKGNDRFDNTNGTVMGTVTMGDGEDIFDNTNGTVTSANSTPAYVDMGGGNDTYYGEGAKVQGPVAGGLGDDTYYVDSNRTILAEGGGEGNDTVISSASYALAENFENLVLSGSGDNFAIGNGLDNALFGNNGANRISGRDGDDFITGQSGDDRLNGGRGNDELNGGEGDDAMRGGRGNDTLLGGDGDDLLRAGSGKDTLNGEDGDDRLLSGIGKDIMSGGEGADVFIFTNVNQSKNSASADVILDFETGLDQIDLSAISATSDPFQPGLLFVPTGPFTGIGHEYRLKTVGGDTEVQVDIDGDTNADMKIIIKGVTLLGEADFIV